MEETTKQYFTSISKKRIRSKPICVEEPHTKKGTWIIVDGGHRLWALEKLFPEGIEMYCVKVREEKM